MTKAKMSETLLPEWPHRILAEDIGLTPIRTAISASPQERKDIARRLKVESVDMLDAALVLTRAPGNMVVHVSGSLTAKVTQLCVVTREPVQQEIETAVEGWFADTGEAVSLARARHEKQGRKMDADLPMLEEEDDPEPLVDGQIDLGELVTQHLSLAIDPYPHKEGVVFEQAEMPGKSAPPPVRRNPFAALKDWKKGGNGEN